MLECTVRETTHCTRIGLVFVASKDDVGLRRDDSTKQFLHLLLCRARVGATELARGSALESLLVESPEDLESVIAALEVALSRPRQGWREDARACSETRSLEAFGREVEAVLLDR